MKKTLFSGIQPTGELHIGNYLGMLKQSVEIQHDYDSIFSIVDYHSITEDFDPQEKKQQIFDAVVTTLACGIDPKKSILFIQSYVPEHAELAWILNCITPVNELERMTQYKDKASRQKHNINMGLFDYPVLMAADILLYKAELVPVGDDQTQHVELARKIARKFNNKFGDFFPEPKTELTDARRIMSLTYPNKKMSKSLGSKSYIALSDSPETIKEKIKLAVTDKGKKDDEFNGGDNLFSLLRFLSKDEKFLGNFIVNYDKENLKDKKKLDSFISSYEKRENKLEDKDSINKFIKFFNDYENGQLKYSELKPALADAIIKTLKPIQAKRNKLLNNKKYINKILEKGAKDAKKIATKNMREIKELIGLI